MKPRIWLLAVGVLLLFSMSGCSMMMVRAPPPRPLWDRVGWAQCTQSRTMPVVDTVMAIGSAVALLEPLFSPTEADPSTGEQAAAFGDLDKVQTISTALMLIGWGLSARYGFKATGQCRQFWVHQMLRRNQRGPLGAGEQPQAGQPLPAPVQPSPKPPAGQPPAAPEPPATGVLDPPASSTVPPSAPDRPTPPPS